MRDTARVISRMVDMVMIRTYEQSKLEEFAKYSKVPVINGLSDSFHPVQILTDYFTILELGIDNPTVAYVGDGNNICKLMDIIYLAKVGFELRSLVTQMGY